MEPNMPINHRQFARKAALFTSAAIALGYAGTVAAQEAAAGVAEVETVVVTGSRLANAGFTAPTPVTTVGQASLQQRAPASMAEALQELPSFRNSAGPTQSTRLIGGAGQQPANLRGLGSGRSLVLIDGRRYVGSSSSFSVDLAQIPTSLVDRVDIVTGGASAAYGSDAVAGVVNFIMNDRLVGLKGSVQYGITGYGKGTEYVGSLGYGLQSKDGRAHFIVGGDYTKTKVISSFYSNDWFRDEPGQVSYGTTRAAGLPAIGWVGSNVESLFTPGSVIISGPLKGTAFDLNGAPYTDNLGQVFGQTRLGSTTNYGTNTQSIQALSNPFERRNFMARGTYEVNDKLTLFTEGNYAFNTNAEGHGDTYLSTGINVPISNPFIPAATRARMVSGGLTSISIGRFNNDIGPWKVFTEWETMRGVVGARGKINDNWSWDAHLLYGQTTQDYNSTPMIDRPNLALAVNVVTGANGQPACATTAQAVANANLTAADALIVESGCVPFNVFGQQNSQAAKDYVTGSVTSNNVISQTSGGINLSGNLIELPAGPLSLAVGGEFRKDRIEAKADPRSDLLAWQTVNQSTYNGEDNVREAYAEAGVPLLKDAPLARSLDLNGAVRRTHYQTSGSVTTWKIGGTWEPSDYLRFRVTESRDIKAPTPDQLFSTPGSGGSTGILNPFTNQVGRLTTISGGNPFLVPERAKTFTGGVVFTPHWGMTQGLKISVDYFDINITGVIASLGAVDTLNGCFKGDQALCKFVIRDNSLYGLQSVAGLPQNLNQLLTRGKDLEVAYRVPLEIMGLAGTLDLRNLTTWVDTLKTTTNAGVASDSAGFMNGVAAMQGNFNVNYALNKLNVNLGARYFKDTRWNNNNVGPDDPTYKSTSSTSVSDNLFPGVVYLNLNSSYDILSEGSRKLQVYGTINNLLNKRPAILGAVAANVSGTQLYDTVGRFFRIGLRFQY